LAQTETRKGVVSFVSSQHIYVRFDNTEGINNGDTLFQQKEDKKVAILLVQDLSTISCLCKPINNVLLQTGEVLIAEIEKPKLKETLTDKEKTAVAVNETAIENVRTKVEDKNVSNKIDGRLSVNSYSVYDQNRTDNFSQRFRYNLSFNASKIANTGLSVETNMAFSHKIGVNSTINESFKIYGAAVNYEFSDKVRASFGRKINASMANVGAVDGLQVEYRTKKISFGALVGSRPDYYDYSIAPTLFQYGAFVGHNYSDGKLYAQTSLAIFNQTNNFTTDRRFAYFQHSNSLLKNLDFFGSVEIDLFGKVNNQLTTKFDLTSTYVSLRYRPLKNLSVSLVYDARKNVYYYETFKNLPDSIFDMETRQGLRFQTNYRPFKFLTVGGSAGYRLATSRSTESMHGNVFLTVPKIPLIDVLFTADASLLKTPYIDGKMYSGTFSRDFAKSRISVDAIYRFIDYQYPTSGIFQQHITELSLHYRITKKLFISTNFEGSYDSFNNSGGRLFVNLTQRF